MTEVPPTGSSRSRLPKTNDHSVTPPVCYGRQKTSIRTFVFLCRDPCAGSGVHPAAIGRDDDLCRRPDPAGRTRQPAAHAPTPAKRPAMPRKDHFRHLWVCSRHRGSNTVRDVGPQLLTAVVVPVQRRIADARQARCGPSTGRRRGPGGGCAPRPPETPCSASRTPAALCSPPWLPSARSLHLRPVSAQSGTPPLSSGPQQAGIRPCPTNDQVTGVAVTLPPTASADGMGTNGQDARHARLSVTHRRATRSVVCIRNTARRSPWNPVSITSVTPSRERC